MKICPWGSLFMKIFLLRWFVLGDFIRGDWTIVKIFLFLEICSWKFLIYFENLLFEIVPLWRFVHCSSLRLKNCFSLLVLRLKIFVLIIWLRVIGLGPDFKMDANLGLEFGILIDSGSDLKFKMICWPGFSIWAHFLHNWVFSGCTQNFIWQLIFIVS